MKYYYEDVEYISSLGFKLFLHSVYNVDSHWHNDFELLFVIKGNIKINYNRDEIVLVEGSVFLVNSNVVHSLESDEENLLLVIQMPKEIFYTGSQGYNYIDFRFITFNERYTESYREITNLLAQLTLLYINKNKKNEMLLKSEFYRVIHIISQYVVDENSPENKILQTKKLVRIIEIINTANEKFKENIPLTEYAEIFDLTPEYLANYFKRYTNISFMTYINNLRVEEARSLILSTEKNMTDIALECGFSSVKSFNTLFKKTIGVTPSSVRKNKDIEIVSIAPKDLNYFDIVETITLKELEKYVLENEDRDLSEIELTRRIRIDCEKETSKINHSWKNLVTIGRASQILDFDIQKMLVETQNIIGFKHIRFHGIFDDDMMIAYIDKQGDLKLNFNQVEKLVDFLLSIGLKPFFELGFMPSSFCSNKSEIFMGNSNISMPKDIEQWNDLVSGFINFLQCKYGKEEVESWYFEFWNEPDVVDLFGTKKFEDYLDLYLDTFNVIKQINKNVKIGGPAIMSQSMTDSVFSKYVSFCKKNDCIPDFITIHIYPLTSEIDLSSVIDNTIEFTKEVGVRVSSDVMYLKKELIKTKKVLKENDLDHLEIFLTEWNSTAWHRDLCSDTTYKSAYIVKNICDNMDRIEGLGYWMLSDFSNEMFPSENLFHGGLGLYTHNGIKKAGFFAYDFLSKLGNELVERGKIHYVTKSKESYQILICNYCHYDSIYSGFDTSLINLTDRSKVFEGNEINVQIIIDNIDSGDYKIKTSKINSASGSAFNEWVNIGAPSIMQKEELEYLKSKAIPSFFIKYKNLNKRYEEVISLEKNEVVLIELVKN